MDAMSRRGVGLHDLLLWGVMIVSCSAVIAWAMLRPTDAGTGVAEDEAVDAIEHPPAPRILLTDQDGEAFDSESLAGEVWVVDFIFTNCAGPCPYMTERMRDLQREFGEAGLRLVSVSVDPNRDTPEALRAYAAAYGADVESWTFLTGEYEVIQALAAEGFRLSVLRGEGSSQVHSGPIVHSTRIVLVDREGRMVGAYIATDADGFEALRAHLRELLD